MVYSKTKIYNLAFTALLLQKRITDANTDTSSETVVFNSQWETSLYAFLEECDLNSTSELQQLNLIEEDPNDIWKYVYRYPSKVALIRRIATTRAKDDRSSLIDKRIGIYEGEKAIFTNQYQAWVEVVTEESAIAGLSANAAQALAHKLAFHSVPLMTSSKNAEALADKIEKRYEKFKLLALAHDAKENMHTDDPEQESDWARARLS